MQAGLERIAIKARSDRELCFTSLAHHVTLELLWDSLKAIGNKSAPGVDRMDVLTAKETFNDWAPDLLESMHRQGYRPPPVKRVFIPKPGKAEKRPIGIPTIIDRALQRAVSKVLEAIYEQDFCGSSFGGRPGRSAHNALATLNKTIIFKKVDWVYEADLKSFFSSLDHEWVERFLAHRVADPRISTLIKRWLKAGVMEQHEFTETEVGTPQGGPISVLISNLYLHYVLDLWIEKKVKPKLDGEVYYFRYLDDFMLCFEDAVSARRFEQVLPKRLEKFGLLLEPSKTRLIRFGRFALRDCARAKQKPQTLYFLGMRLYCSATKQGRFKVGFLTERTRLNRFLNKLKEQMRKWRHLPLRDQCQLINRRLVGHFNYYAIVSNYPAIKRVYYQVLLYWRKVLSSRSQRGRMNWETYRRVLKAYPLRTPRITITFNRLDQLAFL